MPAATFLRRSIPAHARALQRLGAAHSRVLATPAVSAASQLKYARGYSTGTGNAQEASKSQDQGSGGKSGGGGFFGKPGLWIGASVLAASVYYYLKIANAEPAKPTSETYLAAARDIAEAMDDIDYDDGSWGPVLVRLAWHASGTYDKASKTGGSDGGTIRLQPELGTGANAGLYHAVNKLEAIKKKYPQLSYGDLYTLGGVVAIREMGGPAVAWRPGRTDKMPEEKPCPPDGRLPDASKNASHIRDIFYRMGFNDQEIVALSGAHALGRCHTDRSGYQGPWTFSPTTFTNDYYKLLLSEKWVKRKWNGPEQYMDKATGDLMMLPTDMEMVWDKSFKKWTEAYAKDQDLFFDHFAKAFGKLLELGFKPAEDVTALKFPAN